MLKVSEMKHSAVAFCLNRTISEGIELYEAARCCWRCDPKRAAKCDLVFAEFKGEILGVFVADRWVPAASPEMDGCDNPDRFKGKRYAFFGRPADPEVAALYVGKWIPRQRGEANPVRYLNDQ